MVVRSSTCARWASIGIFTKSISVFSSKRLSFFGEHRRSCGHLSTCHEAIPVAWSGVAPRVPVVAGESPRSSIARATRTRILAPEPCRLFEARCNPSIRLGAPLNGEFPSLAHDEGELLVRRFGVRGHQIAGFHGFGNRSRVTVRAPDGALRPPAFVLSCPFLSSPVLIPKRSQRSRIARSPRTWLGIRTTPLNPLASGSSPEWPTRSATAIAVARRLARRLDRTETHR